MVGPDYLRPREPESPSWGELETRSDADQTSEAMPQPVAATWWTTFGDTQLASLIERAIRATLDVRQAEARVLAARASRRISEAGLYPTLDASGSVAVQRQSKRGSNDSTPGNRWEDVFTAGFDASWELDVFGGIRREVQSADASLEATEADRDATLISLFGDVGF